MPTVFDLMSEVGSRARAIENGMSSAVNGVPSWNFTPGRNLKRIIVGDSDSHDNASDGCNAKSRSRVTSRS